MPGGSWGDPRVRGGRATCAFPGTLGGTSLIRWDMAGVRRLTRFPCEGTSQHVAASSQPAPGCCGDTRGCGDTESCGDTVGTARAGGDSNSCRDLDLWGH